MLIVGDRDDAHVEAVLVELGAERDQVMVVDGSVLDGGRWGLNGDGFWVDVDGGRKHMPTAGRGWIRRLARPDWRPGTVAGSLPSAERNAWVDLLVGIIQASPLQWLSALPRVATTDNKVVQWAAARACGVPIPLTAVVSGVDLLPDTFAGKMIVKPLGPSDFVDHRGVAQVVWATVLDRADPILASLGAAPFLVQELIPAVAHLRVVTVNGRVFGGRLAAGGLEADWRRHDDAHHCFEPWPVPERVASLALALTAALGVGYSSQDWIETARAGGHIFLDLNPAGQWLFLPDEVARSVSREIASWLRAGR